MPRRNRSRVAALPLGLALAFALTGCAATRAVGLGPDPDPAEPQKGDTAEQLYQKGRAAFAAGDWKLAGEAFGRVWKEHKGSPLAGDARFYEADARYGRGKYPGAFELYKAYLKEHPLSPHAALIQRRLYDMGVWTIEEGRRGVLGILDYSGEGIEMLDFLVNAFPNGDLADDALIYAADFEWRTHRPQDAVHHLHDLVDHYPSSEWALEGRLRLAKAYRALNRGTAYDADALKRSAAQYRAYVQLVSADRNRAREYGELLGQAKVELAEVEELLARKGLVAADFYLKDGRTEAARQELRNLVRVYPASGAADEARRRLGVAQAAPEPPPPPPLAPTRSEGAPPSGGTP